MPMFPMAGHSVQRTWTAFGVRSLTTCERQTFCGFRGQHRKHVWVLNKAVVKMELLDTVKARELAYYGHTMRKQGSCREKEIMQGTMPGARRRGRPGLSVEELENGRGQG